MPSQKSLIMKEGTEFWNSVQDGRRRHVRAENNIPKDPGQRKRNYLEQWGNSNEGGEGLCKES